MYTEHYSTNDAISAIYYFYVCVLLYLQINSIYYKFSVLAVVHCYQIKGTKTIATQLVTTQFLDSHLLRRVINAFAYQDGFNRDIIVSNFKLVDQPITPSLFKVA